MECSLISIWTSHGLKNSCFSARELSAQRSRLASLYNISNTARLLFLTNTRAVRSYTVPVGEAGYINSRKIQLSVCTNYLRWERTIHPKGTCHRCLGRQQEATCVPPSFLFLPRAKYHLTTKLKRHLKLSVWFYKKELQELSTHMLETKKKETKKKEIKSQTQLSFSLFSKHRCRI